jgi:hypothetical protein
MPFALTVIGLLLIVTGVRNTYAQFGAQVQRDVMGDKGFIRWIIALGAVGAIGYVKDLRTFSHYFMALILISMVLSNQGFFQKFQAAIDAGPVSPTPAADDTASSTSTSPAKADRKPGDITVTPPTKDGTWGGAFKGGPLEFLTPFFKGM